MSITMEQETQEFIRPNENDIILGRASVTRTHPGNVKYRELVDAKKSAYAIAKRKEKKNIAIGILNEVRRLGVRFLKEDVTSGRWFDIGNDKALSKVSQALREGQPERKKIINLEPIPVPLNLENSSDDASGDISEGSMDWDSIVRTIHESVRQLDPSNLPDNNVQREIERSSQVDRAGKKPRRRSSFPPRNLLHTSKYERIQKVAFNDIEQDDLKESLVSGSMKITRNSATYPNNQTSNRNSCFSSSSGGSARKRMSDISIMSGIDLGELELGSIDDFQFGLRSSINYNNTDSETNDTIMEDADMGEILNLFGEDINSGVISETTTTTTTTTTTMQPSHRQSIMTRRSVLIVKNYLSKT
jgi:hypothetical protein